MNFMSDITVTLISVFSRQNVHCDNIGDQDKSEMNCFNVWIDIILHIVVEPTNEMQLYVGKRKWRKSLFDLYDYLFFY